MDKPGVPGEQIVIRARENKDFDRKFEEDLESDWRYLSWWNNKTCFVTNCRNTDESCNVTFAEGHETHALLT